MPKLTRKPNKELEFVRRFCLAGTYPASDERCQYAKFIIKGGFPKSRKTDCGSGQVDAMYLCRYPDRIMPLHKARLIAELEQCPDLERRQRIDTLDFKAA